MVGQHYLDAMETARNSKSPIVSATSTSTSTTVLRMTPTSGAIINNFSTAAQSQNESILASNLVPAAVTTVVFILIIMMVIIALKIFSYTRRRRGPFTHSTGHILTLPSESRHLPARTGNDDQQPLNAHKNLKGEEVGDEGESSFMQSKSECHGNNHWGTVCGFTSIDASADVVSLDSSSSGGLSHYRTKICRTCSDDYFIINHELLKVEVEVHPTGYDDTHELKPLSLLSAGKEREAREKQFCSDMDVYTVSRV